jgi:hypothetical protein
MISASVQGRRKRAETTAFRQIPPETSGNVHDRPFSKLEKPIGQENRTAKWFSNDLRNKGASRKKFSGGGFTRLVCDGSDKGNVRVNVMDANFLPGFSRRQGEKSDRHKSGK